MQVFDIVPVKYENEDLFVLDQTRLPGEEIYCKLKSKEDVWEAINRLRVRGAPAIGVAAGYGLYISVRDFDGDNLVKFGEKLRDVKNYLITSRPTAVNLEWALLRMEERYKEFCCETALNNDIDGIEEIERLKKVLLEEAHNIRIEDEENCKAMGKHGLSLLKKGMGILTHCNAGTLATAKYGTCLSPIYLGKEKGYEFKVFADETRPLLQGARLTTWELKKAEVDVTLICDNMASQVMKNGWVQAVVVGCDRMAANGDGANKIGTSGVAILAKEYGIPFYMFVPTSTIDMNTRKGDDIIIEERDGEEIYKMWYKKPMAPEGVKTFNPAFDVTNHKYITAIVTEKGILRPPYKESIKKLMDGE
ncbi:MAG: S-methyl-5-thioribose-1-phosphate isomerase [Clostridiales bacterium]|nr:S-methyl-5-thioribose-1-phosphate isomerase [Clostridiales bacterium]